MKAQTMLLTSLLLFSIAPTVFSQSADTVVVKLEAGENVWGGRIADGSFMPYKAGFEGDMYNDRNNQIQPLMLTDKGRFISGAKSHIVFL